LYSWNAKGLLSKKTAPLAHWTELFEEVKKFYYDPRISHFGCLAYAKPFLLAVGPFLALSMQDLWKAGKVHKIYLARVPGLFPGRIAISASFPHGPGILEWVRICPRQIIFSRIASPIIAEKYLCLLPPTGIEGMLRSLFTTCPFPVAGISYPSAV